MHWRLVLVQLNNLTKKILLRELKSLCENALCENLTTENCLGKISLHSSINNWHNKP